MISALRHALIGALIGQLFPLAQSGAAESCTSQHSVARQVILQAEREGPAVPVFRIARQSDGQAILYWDHGDHSKSFYAVTFRANGCAILTGKGNPRRFIFPKSAYNSGVFYEMDLFGPM